MRLKKLLGTLCLCAGLSFTAQADINADASAELQQLLDRFDSLSASFDQVSGSDQSHRMEQSRGTLLLAKPNRFNWIAQAPFPQQLVSDGETLWIYDPDLEQATRRTVGAAASGVPALILNGQIDQLKAQYRIRLLHQQEASQLFELLPLAEGEVFTRIRLLFTDGIIAELQMEDSLGQRTSILFAEQQLNPAISAGAFSFEPPEGTDIIIEDQQALSDG